MRHSSEKAVLSLHYRCLVVAQKIWLVVMCLRPSEFLYEHLVEKDMAALIMRIQS